MHYDDFNPFGFSPTKEGVKKKIRKKRTMASIHQYKALSNITNAASVKYVKTLENVDKKLHEEGVRPGQVWVLPYGSDTYYLAFVGYHEKGFLMLNLRTVEDSPIPTVSLFKYPRKLKMDLLENIVANNAKMLSCVVPTLLDENGEALPNREMDVTLASLMVRPAFWHNHDTKQDHFLSICKKGHHRVSTGYLPSGHKCDEFCFNAAQTEPMALLSDIIFDKIYYGKNNTSTFKLRASEARNLESSLTSWCLVEDKYESIKIIGSNKAGVRSTKFIPSVHPDPTDWRQKTRKWLDLNKLRSGQVFPLEYSSYRSGKVECNARLHIKACGNLHVELTDNLIFTGVTNPELLRKVASSTEILRLKLSKDKRVEIGERYPFVKCPHCNSEHPIICIYEAFLNDGKYKSVTPIIADVPKEKRIAAPGDVVKFRGDTALYLKKVTNRRGPRKAMVMTKNKKFTTIPEYQIKRISEATTKDKQFFVDGNNFLNRTFSLENWYKLIIPGTKLKIHPSVSNKNLLNLAGFNVTVTNTPFLSSNRPVVNIIESDSLVYLDKDVTACNIYPIEKGMHFRIRKESFVLEELKEGSVILLSKDNKETPVVNVSEAAIHLALERGNAYVLENNTVENLLAELSE